MILFGMFLGTIFISVGTMRLSFIILNHMMMEYDLIPFILAGILLIISAIKNVAVFNK
jgi:hypothetical protein